MFGASQTPFGSSGGGGFGQPANSTPAFGAPAPAAFGQAPAAGGFGGSSFGAPAPAPGGFGGGGFGAAPAPGGFGAAPAPGFGAAPAPATGFGAPSPGGFGAPASSPFGAPAPATGGLFGAPAPAPATGGLFGAPAPSAGGFGAAPAAGGFGGGAFGASAAPAFGAPAQAPGMFGSPPAPAPGGLFGSAPAPAPGGFGNTMGGFGGMGTSTSTTTAFGAPAPATGGLFGSPAPTAPVGGVFGSSAGATAGTGGTTIVPFQPTTRQDGTNQITLHSISAMQQYSAKSFEELRLEDYSQGNKGTGAAQAGGFGAPATGGFGAPAPAPTVGLFGAPPTAATGAFGAAPAPAIAFGGFGVPAPAAGVFGAPAPAAFGSPAAAIGAFGAPAAPAFGAAPSAFGATPPTTGGLFGAPAPTPATGGLFGAPAPAPAAGGLFGAPAAAPVSAFGAAPAPAGGLFGAPPPVAGGMFGAPAPAPSFGAAPGAFGGFGAAPAQPTSLFGAASTPTLAAGGLFGAAPAPSLFGAPSPAPAPGGLFGAPAVAPIAQPQMAATYAAPPLGAVMPPAANEIMASQLAALDSKRKEMEQNDNFRNKPSESSSVTAISFSERESRRNMIGPVTPARISSYRASPMSNAKLRPRGFASPTSDTTITNIPQSLSKLGTGGKPMAAPETVAASSATRLIIAPSPRPKLKLTLGGGEKRTVRSAAATTPRNINGGLGSVQNAPFMESLESVSTPKATPINGSSDTPKNGDIDRAQQYYQQVICSPDHAAGTPGSSKKHTGAPTLSKEGYTCHPSIATLQELDPADLAAISNFFVMRKGVGKVAWEGAVDVRGANLDRIVVIEPKAVSIYTEEEEEGRKPEVGTKLNRSAVLTLENVFPLDPCAPEKFVNKVTRQTMKMDAELISYDPSSGEWILRVQHFSRYALDDEDDDEDMEIKEPELPELQEDSHKGKVDFRLGEREGRSPILRKDGLNKMTRQDTPYKRKGLFLGEDDEVEEEHDATMKTNDVMTESSIMDEAETAYTQMQVSLEAENVIIAVKKKIEKDTALFPDESMPVAEDRNTSGNRRYIPDLQDLRAAASMPSFSSKLAKINSISTSRSSSTDFGFRMGRSFRVGWSADGSFFSVGKNGVLIRSKPKLETLNIARELKLLETHRSYVHKTNLEEHCPLLSLSSKIAGTNPIKDTLESYSAAVKDTSGSVSSISDSVYSLLQVLHESKIAKESYNSQAIVFGTANKPADHIIDNQCLLSITRWFINSCCEEVGNEIFQARAKQNKYKALLSAVSGGDLTTAAKIAEEENLFQLSILLASGPEGRKDIFQEIMAWRKAGNERSIPEDLSRTYRLIAGDLGIEEDVYKKSIKGSTTFDWRRRMVMTLMFSKAEQACKSLSSAIDQYEAGVSKGVAPFPSAHYCNNDVESTLFRLLRLGTQTQMSSTVLSLSNVVDPLGYTYDPNNFSLSFHLTSCITSIYASPSLSPEEEYTLLDGYAFQLQSLGLWEWAVYVFLCVLSDTARATSMWRIQRAKSLVLQNYFDDDNANAKKRLFLEKLGLPSNWFEEASCYRSFSTGDTFGYIAHNLNLDPEKATKILERTLVPNILFINREKRDSILQLFERLSLKMEHQSLVSAVSTFFAICEEIEELERCYQAEIEESVPDLMEACEDIQQIFSAYKASEEKLADNGLDIVPENYLVPLGSFLAEALHQTSHFKLQLLALKAGMGISNTASQMLKLVRSQGPSDYSIGNRENVCRWLM